MDIIKNIFADTQSGAHGDNFVEFGYIDCVN